MRELRKNGNNWDIPNAKYYTSAWTGGSGATMGQGHGHTHHMECYPGNPGTSATGPSGNHTKTTPKRIYLSILSYLSSLPTYYKQALQTRKLVKEESGFNTLMLCRQWGKSGEQSQAPRGLGLRLYSLRLPLHTTTIVYS
ncbi:Hypothetical predicted protein [Pelobates cultripes]|uniref:Uncharacterized protein n=1 Tax=Pelobates cultripes TaxID=61616 RepID=A0AAD1VXR1_PELCU|nr:Hypothetical predicted protein [Pelobates cultripes]